ncbi:hypothetical protein ElyMa_006266800 [Elysia marginata]|uniref:Uncharacterized protein n=1 Tax=Elysia marginata TaxID=1093978 RepID=A0AAV4HE60_9GAST|nr:hypothetical protein ElyMa_006266800 [Elysia marginata]
MVLDFSKLKQIASLAIEKPQAAKHTPHSRPRCAHYSMRSVCWTTFRRAASARPINVRDGAGDNTPLCDCLGNRKHVRRIIISSSKRLPV